MEPWHWHPIFVHFTVGLLFTASVLFIVRAVCRDLGWEKNCLTAAVWMFWIGIVITLITAASGLMAYLTLPHLDENTRSMINKHVIAAVLTAATYLLLAFFLWKHQRRKMPPSNGWTTFLFVGLVLLACTGYLGGNLVFDRGIGVNVVTGTKG
jgi:uncharacterized membrane protein